MTSWTYGEDKLKTIEYYLHCKRCRYSAMATTRTLIVSLYDIHLAYGSFNHQCSYADMSIYWAMANKVRLFRKEEIDETLEHLSSSFFKTRLDSR